MAEPAHSRDQPLPGRKRLRHRDPRRARPGVATARTSHCHRAAARRRRNRRFCRGRSLRARWLHAGDEFVVDGHRTRAAQDAALRPGSRFRSGGFARHLAERAGGVEAERVQDGGRSRCRRQGQARDHNVCIGRHRLVVTYGRRAFPARRQDRRAPCAVPRRRAHRSDGGAHRLLFHPAGGCRLGPEQRQARRRRRQLADARAAAAECSLDRRGRLPECRVPFLERRIGTGQDAARDRTETARQDRRGAQASGGAGKTGQARCRAADISVEDFAKFFQDDLAATTQLAKEANIQPID